jgi:acetolactate synthase-1/2/3 large subunit
VPLERIPYAVPQAVAFLKGFKNIITVETGEPIAFFSYPDKPSLLKAPGHGARLVETGEDSVLGLEMLLDAWVVPRFAAACRSARTTAADRQAGADQHRPRPGHGHARALHPGRRVLTTGRESMGLTAGALPHDTIQNMGGSIGYGTPVATGAALACPDRRVFCMVGDGSAMYTIQSLWTQAREGLNVTTIIFANHSYQILKTEFANMGFGAPGPQALAMIDIDKPRIDWVAMGTSMGVPSHGHHGRRTSTRAWSTRSARRGRC